MRFGHNSYTHLQRTSKKSSPATASTTETQQGHPQGKQVAEAVSVDEIRIILRCDVSSCLVWQTQLLYPIFGKIGVQSVFPELSFGESNQLDSFHHLASQVLNPKSIRGIARTTLSD